VPFQQLGQKFLVNRDLASFQSSYLLLIVIDDNDLVAELSKTSSCHQANIS
jgi:hypothetical protein